MLAQFSFFQLGCMDCTDQTNWQFSLFHSTKFSEV